MVDKIKPKPKEPEAAIPDNGQNTDNAQNTDSALTPPSDTHTLRSGNESDKSQT